MYFSPDSFWSKLQTTYHFSPEYSSLGILNLPEFSGQFRGFGKLLPCAPRVSLQIVLVFEKVSRSHSRDLLIRKRRECAHWLSLRPSAGVFLVVSYLTLSTTVWRQPWARFGGNWTSKWWSNLPRCTQWHYSAQAYLTPSNYTIFVSSSSLCMNAWRHLVSRVDALEATGIFFIARTGRQKW